MIVEIWSDVVCPFCYIGKRKLEKALSLFENREHVEVVWRSYQLYPDVKTQPNKTIYEFMAEKHGITVEQIKNEYSFINDMAAEVGLKYQLDKAILVNTRNAHRLLQMAKRGKKDNIAEEILFKSYFIENKNIDDIEVLEKIAEEIGFDKLSFKSELLSLQNDEGIDSDIYQSRQIGVRGVPFFLINNSISISGAQDISVFIDGLSKGWNQINS